MVRPMDQLEGAMDDANDGSKSNKRSDGWCERWFSQKERWMMQAMDQKAIERATDDASDGSKSNRMSDEWCVGWTSEQQKERQIVRAVDHGAIDGATDGASDGSESEVANYTDCKLSYKALI